jgi:hypothetical protein
MRSILTLGLVAFTLLACGDHDHDHGNIGPNDNTQPMAVVVDTNQTMTPSTSQGFGGEGIGVFVEYHAGGHWHVYWACDTTLSGSPCSFSVTATVADGSIANATSSQFSGNDNMTSTSSQISASTFTTTQVDTVDFDTTPGDQVTINAVVAGLPQDGSFFFFVQDGVVNGNYTGPLTDPLIFEPSTP